MRFNLIDEKWIPVKRHDGTEEMIAPWEVTDRFVENPVVLLNASRPDFNGALIQFLIGLVQTAAPPANGVDWKIKLKKPLEPEELQIKCAAVRNAFELAGDGPRFMQDFDRIDTPEKSIARLLIDMPGEHTCEQNKDHFVKRDSVVCMCPACCATALFTMQTNAPSGGVGYRTSLRGGGPLSTLVVGDERHNTLWHTVWLNVLENAGFLASCGNASLAAEACIFPWLAGTRASDSKAGIDTTPEDTHPAMVYWGMPRRIRLTLGTLKAGRCGICDKRSDRLIDMYREKNYGMNFTGAWLHPLSPYGRNKDGLPLPAHAQEGGLFYRHWLGFVQEDSSDKRTPARVVHEFREIRQQSDWQFRLWAFGYDMDNMKARCWYEAKMPLLQIEASQREHHEHCVAAMIKTAVEIAGNIRTAVKKAWFRRPSEVKGDTSFLTTSFWQNTEPDFYETLQALKEDLGSGGDTMACRAAWLDSLCKEALVRFDAYAWEGPIEDADPKRVVIARKDLGRFNRGKKIKDLLELTVEGQPKASAVSKRASKVRK
ncbi:MAG: type I-E CRISPR-associated protein Cse1/CasA [Syntrophobacteraceae bacterium]|nr:type I-E CRISPR-associated protein Cse1/CasA [Syntrophobacteraceae bacterium]